MVHLENLLLYENIMVKSPTGNISVNYYFCRRTDIFNLAAGIQHSETIKMRK
jgi:hypothetical protein